MILDQLRREQEQQFLNGGELTLHKTVSRPEFLGLMKELRDERIFYTIDEEAVTPILRFSGFVLTAAWGRVEEDTY